MEVIARKNGSYTVYAIINFVMAIAGVLGCILGNVFLPLYWYKFLALLVFPAIGIPLGINCVTKMRLPMDLIYLDGDKITLYNGQSFVLSEIKDVTYKHASSRYGTLTFGRIIFVLEHGEPVKVYPVAEVEEVGKRISKLIYSQKSN